LSPEIVRFHHVLPAAGATRLQYRSSPAAAPVHIQISLHFEIGVSKNICMAEAGMDIVSYCVCRQIIRADYQDTGCRYC